MNEHLQYLTASWEDYNVNLNTIRDTIQLNMHAYNSEDFPCDNIVGTDIHALCRELFKNSRDKTFQIDMCRTCNLQISSKQYLHCHWDISFSKKNSVAVALRSYMHNANTRCRCGEIMTSHIEFGAQAPPLFAFIMSQTMTISKTFTIKHNDINVKYMLSGIVYHGGNHFTCRVFDRTGTCWYSDGAENAGTPVNEGKFNAISNLHTTRGRNICLTIYSISS